MADEEVKEGDTVRVHYTGRLDSGEVFDSSQMAGQPLEFRVGAGEVIPGFDDGVRGMKVGDEKTVHIKSDDAYGPRHEGLRQSIPREHMNLGQEPEVGMQLLMQIDEENRIPVTVTEVTDEHVTIDANHPLAGQDLTFDIQLVEKES